jgi:hypothetical protein
VNKEELQKLWEDERHWGHGSLGCYFCKEDPRLVVPKRRLIGGTFNLAHHSAIPLLTAIFLLLVVLIVVGFLGAGVILLESHQRQLVDGSDPTYKKHVSRNAEIPPTAVGGFVQIQPLNRKKRQPGFLFLSPFSI